MHLNRHRRHFGERGAVAVEFALIVPVLVVMMVGLIEFSFAFNAQITINNAAREAARTMAIHNDVGQSTSAAVNAASTLNPALTASQVSISPGSCTPNATVKVTVTYQLTPITGFFGLKIPIRAVGAMLCGG